VDAVRRGGQRLGGHLRVPDLSVGTYCIPAGGLDNQSPHTEDEIYVVTAGTGQYRDARRYGRGGPGFGDLRAWGGEHRFDQVTQDLALLVVFGPAYGSRMPRQ
jgi:hypothetical protein